MSGTVSNQTCISLQARSHNNIPDVVVMGPEKTKYRYVPGLEPMKPGNVGKNCVKGVNRV